MSSSNTTGGGTSAGGPSGEDAIALANTTTTTASSGGNPAKHVITRVSPTLLASGSPESVPRNLIQGPNITTHVYRDGDGNIQTLQVVDDPPPARKRDRVKEGVKEASTRVANCLLGCCCKLCCGV